jgi:transposase InsO family protein
LCQRAQISRQGYYKQTRHRQRRELDEQRILNAVRRIRQWHSRMGTRKLLFKLISHGFSIGRDRLFDLLGRHGLLIPRRRRYQRTTNSQHGFRTYPNLLRLGGIEHPHQAWASDLTYIRTNEGYLYLALITDVNSRYIVGHSVNDTLEAEGCLSALKMAQAQLPPGCRPIHHSDRGSQYCSHAYIGLLDRWHFPVSMTEENHCYENALAERINGILKHEYGLKQLFPTKAMARRACEQAIALYNQERPHLCLEMQTPAQVHAA